MDNNGHKGGKLGKVGEDEAAAFLAENGHTVLERNWRSGHLEIDIITFSPDGIHFVEVKSRKSNSPVIPEESVDAAKTRRIATAAAKYMSQKKISEESHMDVISVTFDGFGTEIRYIPDAYIPIYL